MAGKIEIGVDLESVADIKSPTAAIEALTATGADVGTIFADTYQNLPGGGGGGGGGDVDANTIIDALGYTPVAPGDVIALANNALFANVATIALTANNATYLNGQEDTVFFARADAANTRAASAQSAAISAYTNAIAYSGNAVAAYQNAIAYAATIAGTAYTNAIAYSGNAAAAYTNAVSYANTTFLPLAGGTLTGAVYPNANGVSFGNNTNRFVVYGVDAYVSGNVGIGTISPGRKLGISGDGIKVDNGTASAVLELYSNTDFRLQASTDFSLYDVTAGATRIHVAANGNIGLGGNTTPIYALSVTGVFMGSSYVYGGAGGTSAGYLYSGGMGHNGRTTITAPSDGVISLFNGGANNFGRLTFGASNTSFSSIKNNGTGLQIRLGDDSAFANLTAHTITANVIGTANNANNLGGQLPAYYANATHGHGFLRHSMTLAGNMDTANSTNFRTTLFGSNTNGYNFSVVRWNTTVPSFLPNMASHGTMLGWSGSDTQAFLAVNYNAANVAIGGGSGDNVNWVKNIAFLDSNISGTANNATNLGGQPNTYYLNSGNQNAGVLPAARLAQNTGYYTIDPLIPSHGILHNTLSTPSIAEAAIERAYVENKTMFAVPNVVEYSTDSGGSYADASGTITNTMLKTMVVGRGSGNQGVTVSDQTWTNLRFQWDHASFEFGYVFFNYLYVYYQTAGHTISSILIEKQDNDTSVWSTVATTGSFSGWPAHAWVPHTNISFSASSGRNKAVRITFTFSWSGTYPANSINLYNINWYGTYPAGKHDRVWSWNTEREVTFANTVQPASNNKNLGISAQRWNLYANVINSTGLATLTTANVTSTAELRGVTTAYANVVPSANGGKLGLTAQRWDIYANSIIATAITGDLTGNVTGTASNATNLNSQPGSYYTNASNMSTGTIPFARLPSVDSVSNTSTSHVPVANNVKTAYDAAIAANTLANTASTKADAAYTNAIAFAANASNMNSGTVTFALLPSNNSVTNTSISHVPTANNVKTAYDAAIAANTLANTASTKADAAYTNAIAYSGNATAAYSNAIAFASNASNINSGTIGSARLPSGNSTVQGAVIVLDSVVNTSITVTAAANSVKTAYDVGIAANTRAASAQTAAISAYSNAVTYADTVAGTAYTNAITWSGNAAAAYANAIAFASNSSNQNTGTLNAARLPASGVTPGTYGNTSVYPVITVDTYGRITSVTTDADGGGGGASLDPGDGLGANSTHYYVNANTGLVANADGLFVTWNAPGTIGSGTANSGAFTTLTTSGNTDHGNNNVTGARMKSYKEFNSSLGTISSNNVTLDLSTSNFFDMTLANNAINVSFSNPPATGNVFTFSVIARQDATGSRVLTWPAAVKWPNNVTPTLTTTANKIDILQLMTVDGGTTYFGGFSLGNL